MAAVWGRIGQEHAFMGRCGDVGDDLGSRMVATRLARELMRLCFMIEKTYAPYIKWFGTAFSRLDCSPRIQPLLENVLAANDWKDREAHLSNAYSAVGEMHNSLGITPPLPTEVVPFHTRPYLVPHSEAYFNALRDALQDEAVRQLPAHLGSINLFIDSTDILSGNAFTEPLKAMYGE
jgi:hypothetical protein